MFSGCRLLHRACNVAPTTYNVSARSLSVKLTKKDTGKVGLSHGGVGPKQVFDRDVLAEEAQQIDMSVYSQKSDIFPTTSIHDLTINGVLFDEIPIAHIQTSKNNTIVSIADAKGIVKSRSSGGLEGFKGSKKGSSLAAQRAGFTAGDRAKLVGIDQVRVKIKGFGIGRLPVLTGLQQAGMAVVSITDDTARNYGYMRSQRPPNPRSI